MMDEHFDRNYQVGRAELHAGIDALGRRLWREASALFNAIHRINFSAPWTPPRSP
ncbi:hypothetical protein [Sphingomonas sp.]|uniref:hypothetical protein n=1 Tax=Sphingomonas sp. TaxID=28214 RepID=UPI00286CB8C4|nr:hypothetical protein [Sphingomonas sp.]